MFRTTSLLVCTAMLLAATTHAQQPDLATPDVQKLKSEALTQRAEIVRQRTDALRKLIDDQLENARQALTKAKVSGNITATASGNAAVKTFTDVKAAFDKDGSTAIAGKVRTDLEATADEFTRNVLAVEDKQAADLKKINKAFAARLGEILTQQKTPVADEAKLLELWAPLINTAAGAPAGAGPSTPAGVPTGTNAHVALPAASAVLQSQGETANWTQLMKVEITVHDAVEIVSVPLTGLTAPKSFDGTGGGGNPWQAQATPYQELAPGNATPAFRIQSLPPFKPLDVAVWPNARNNWTIDLRAKAVKIPSRHAVVIETDAAVCKPLAGGKPDPTAPTTPAGGPAAGPAASPSTSPADPAHGSPTSMIKVRFESQPVGATVLINNQPLAEHGSPLLTPFDYAMTPNAVDLIFRKHGFKDAVLRQSLPLANKPFHVTLVEAPMPVDVTVPIPANATTDWTPTGVHVRKGSQVRIAASGSWSCASGGEMVDADGYPNNDTYFKYYIDPLQNPRISSRANYGQLLARVLPDGEITSIGKQGSFVASADGDLVLAINEQVNARKDNRGTVKAHIMMDP